MQKGVILFIYIIALLFRMLTEFSFDCNINLIELLLRKMHQWPAVLEKLMKLLIPPKRVKFLLSVSEEWLCSLWSVSNFGGFLDG
jgi:hypothetical protein